MKSHSPQVGPDSARLRSIWLQHWKGEGLSFPSTSLPSFCFVFPHCAETWQPTSQGRVPLLHPLAYWQHPVFVLHKGWLRAGLWWKVNKAKDDARVCKPSNGWGAASVGSVCECVCFHVNVGVRKPDTSLYSVQNKWHTPLKKLEMLASQCPLV